MIEVYNKDCRELFKDLKDDSFNLIHIDPPYIISRPSGFVNNDPSRKDYIAKYGKHVIDFGSWDHEELDWNMLFKNFYRILKDSGTIIIWYDIWKIYEIKNVAETFKFKQPRICKWEKTNPVPRNSKINYLTNGTEYFVSFVKGFNPTFNSEYDTGTYQYLENENSNIIYQEPILHGNERTKHPTQKPLKIIKDLILKHSKENDMILDCFGGVYTTAVACKETNRNCVSCEIIKEWHEEGLKRL